MRTDRRSFLGKGLLGGAILALGGSLPILLRSGLAPRGQKVPPRIFTATEYTIFAVAAARLVPPNGAPGDWPSSETLDCAGKVDALLARLHPKPAAEFRQLLHVFENAMTGLVTIGLPTTFTRSSPTDQDRRLAAWQHSRLALFRSGYQAMKRLAHAAYYSSPEIFEHLGYPGPPVVPQVPA